MVPLVERNYNYCELGPRGTGKSHIYKEISPYSILMSGGQTSTANLFYNLSAHRVGLVGHWDCVAFDEVAGMHFRDMDAIQILKDYMASGRSTPAFAREIAEVYNFSLKFSDPKKEEASHDRTLLAEAEKFRDEIRKSVPEAFEKYYMYMESKGTVPVEEKQKKKTEEVQNQPAKGKRLVVDGLDWSSLRKHRKRHRALLCALWLHRCRYALVSQICTRFYGEGPLLQNT